MEFCPVGIMSTVMRVEFCPSGVMSRWSYVRDP